MNPSFTCSISIIASPVARDVGVFRSRGARSVVADVAIGDGAARARRVRGGMGADGIHGRDARHGLEARFTAP